MSSGFNSSLIMGSSMETATTKALKEALAYLETNHRTEETLELRRSLNIALVDQLKYVVIDPSSKAIPSINCEKPDWWEKTCEFIAFNGSMQ
jgi:hypothetical protein